MAELPAGFAGKRYNSRKKVAQAHGIPAAAFGKPRSSARAPDAGAKSGADCSDAFCDNHMERCCLSRGRRAKSSLLLQTRMMSLSKRDPACMASN